MDGEQDIAIALLECLAESFVQFLLGLFHMPWVFAVPGSPVRPRQFEFVADSHVFTLENGVKIAAKLFLLVRVIVDVFPDTVNSSFLSQVLDRGSDDEINIQLTSLIT